MKKLTLLLLIAISCGFYTGVRAQVNVTSVSEKNDADNFYKMMKEAFPLSFNDTPLFLKENNPGVDMVFLSGSPAYSSN